METLDVKVQGSSLTHRIVSLDKELYSTNCLSSSRWINGYRQHAAMG